MSNSPLVNYTYISPHKTSPRVYPITKITIHHMAGNLTVEQCGRLFQSRQAASNYGIGSDGRVGMYVEEKDRAWCSANYDNDHRAINIEVANDGGEPSWHVSDVALNKLIDLCVDVCQRNGIKKLNFTGDKSGNLTQHNYFTATACPGPYLKSKFPWIAEQVNARLSGGGGDMYKLRIGYASSGDVRTFERLLDSMGVTYSEADGYIFTGELNSSQKDRIEAEAKRLVVPCIVTSSPTPKPEPKPEPTPEPTPVPSDEYKELYEATLEQLETMTELYNSTATTLVEVQKEFQNFKQYTKTISDELASLVK